MPDAEIQILISLQNEMSKTLAKVEGDLRHLSDNSSKQNAKMGESFTRVTDSLIAMGNASQSVDAIFSALTNMEIRLENATIRVTNAQESLEDSGRALAKAQEKNRIAQDELRKAQDRYYEGFRLRVEAEENALSASENLADAERDHERASRALTLAQNNLERANNQVLGTYLNIGVQSLSLARSLPSLTASIGGLGLALGGVGLAAGATYLLFKDNAEAQMAVKHATQELADVWNNSLNPAITRLSESLEPLIPFLKDELFGVIKFITDTIELLALGVDAVAASFEQWGEFIRSAIEGIKSLVDWIEQLIEKIGQVSLGSMGNVNSEGSSGKSGKKVGDAIMRPDGSVIETDPRDTLVAMKDVDTSMGGLSGRGGLVVNINGNIYGMNPTDISRALAKELGRKINI